MNADTNSFDDLVSEAMAAPFSGWDFSHLKGRMIHEAPPWSYVALARSALANSRHALDMGTGGGEILASLQDAFAGRITATEGYEPNVEAARARLEPLGIDVMFAGNETAISLEDAVVDLVLNRHDSLPSEEIFRVLEPGGVLLSQQVGSDWLTELNDTLGHPVVASPWNLAVAADQLESAGFEIDDGQEARSRTTFTDVGAIIYYLKAVPWQMPEFDVDRDREKLLALHRSIEKHGHFATNDHRFLVRAIKPR